MYFITLSKIIYSFLKKRNLSYIIANLFYQNKNVMMDLMESLEYVRAYIDDLLVITRGTLKRPPRKTRGGSQEAARGRIESQCC